MLTARLDYRFARMHGEGRFGAVLFALFGSTQVRDIPEMLAKGFGLAGRR